ncbi:uncharacterized protein LACBIDRAFT_330666 [Laccaria bicolor S238N-H82]|uniref:Predicted protein n=1 Tax=Laccaria bicolor (strain S238N-H82 / ATCC MYA-4686) TaxID=486041 RepID=B0DM25_LACBS|nr:uncharacterized protein LACBIDRAFT_330666 [Laccaria bicolor S238N-H82]EDR04398.1 predicted protein [Laccaria bicolor S238N-H82]|eukprot:XP_001884917.1 predicted protein [Laccaria bicolor S238N-H82]
MTDSPQNSQVAAGAESSQTAATPVSQMPATPVSQMAATPVPDSLTAPSHCTLPSHMSSGGLRQNPVECWNSIQNPPEWGREGMVGNSVKANLVMMSKTGNVMSILQPYLHMNS